mgnify:CR=1 FL=1
MSGQTSHKLMQAIALYRAGMSAYKSAKTAGIALSTMYRSQIYKDLREYKKTLDYVA